MGNRKHLEVGDLKKKWEWNALGGPGMGKLYHRWATMGSRIWQRGRIMEYVENTGFDVNWKALRPNLHLRSTKKWALYWNGSEKTEQMELIQLFYCLPTINIISSGWACCIEKLNIWPYVPWTVVFPRLVPRRLLAGIIASDDTCPAWFHTMVTFDIILTSQLSVFQTSCVIF